MANMVINDLIILFCIGLFIAFFNFCVKCIDEDKK